MSWSDRLRLARERWAELGRNLFPSKLHEPRTAAILGIALGVTFSICFLTGLYSNYQQDQSDALFVIPARPAGLYRFTQGLHVATGIASIPLLLAKLWTVLPRFFEWPKLSARVLIERTMLIPLVVGSLFLLFSGVGNIALWRPWRFSFTTGHYWAAWITVGALVAHIAAKSSLTLQELRPRRARVPLTPDPGVMTGGLSRRGFLGAVAAASGVLTVATIGQTFRPFRAVSVLAPRDPQVGPQGVPVNRTARQASVVDLLGDPDYRMTISSPSRTISLSYDELRALPQTEAVLPISCVEGWSANGTWRGVPLSDLAEMVDAADAEEAVVRSMQPGARFTSSRVAADQLRDRHSLIALDLNGEPLHEDHGYPARLICPNRAGVLQTKWLDRVEFA